MYSIFRDLAIIILSAKFFALVARKCKAPQVVGEILAGLLIGPCLLNLVQTSDAISTFAEIGVVLLMFTTGLGTNLKELLRAGPIATLIACIGVFVPLAGGTLLYSTCTVRKEENEDVARTFLLAHPEFSPEPFAVPAGLDLKNEGYATVLPQKHAADGFFICKLRRHA